MADEKTKCAPVAGERLRVGDIVRVIAHADNEARQAIEFLATGFVEGKIVLMNS